MNADTADRDTAADGAAGPQTPARHDALDALDVLVGTWTVESSDLDGGSSSTTVVTRHWMPGRRFLVQRVSAGGGHYDSVEYVGYDHDREEIRSMLFGEEGPGPFSFALEYVWEIDGDHLTIWHGDRGSPAAFSGEIDRQAGTVAGRWVWPGGGYLATSTRHE